MCLGSHFGGRFEKWGVCQSAQNGQMKKNSTFSYTKSELKGSLFYEKKIANSCIWGPTVQAILDKWGCQPIGPNWTHFDF